MLMRLTELLNQLQQARHAKAVLKAWQRYEGLCHTTAFIRGLCYWRKLYHHRIKTLPPWAVCLI